MQAVFVSDLHLKSMDERNGQTLLRFFLSLAGEEKPPTVFLLGDIFDVWVSGHGVFVERFRPLLNALETLRAKGARVVYFEGNHDMHLAPFWRDVLGAEVYVAPAFFDIGGLRVRCEHGDEINLDAKWYLRLRAVLRHPFTEWLAHTLPGKFWDGLAHRMSGTSRQYSADARQSRESDIRARIRAHAERVYDMDPFDMIVSGHMHVQDDWIFERAGKKIRSVNLGSWFEEPKALVVRDGRADWMKV